MCCASNTTTEHYRKNLVYFDVHVTAHTNMNSIIKKKTQNLQLGISGFKSIQWLLVSPL